MEANIPARYEQILLADKLISCGFECSLIDKCMCYKVTLVFLCYVDDGIFVSLDDTNALFEMALLQIKNLMIEDKGHPNDYIGVNISKYAKEFYVFTQPMLIDTIFEEVSIAPTQPIKFCPSIPSVFWIIILILHLTMLVSSITNP